ncbi:MAG: helix-turn-helix transcriptional regulator [Mycobacterium sp.]|nr:helix-turn-helix transcriptional regulator [Mycobacterium sp.]
MAQLARDGLTNPQIACQIFLSSRTVEWRLDRIFAKLGISSRRELDVAMATMTYKSAAQSRQRD